MQPARIPHLTEISLSLFFFFFFFYRNESHLVHVSAAASVRGGGGGGERLLSQQPSLPLPGSVGVRLSFRSLLVPRALRQQVSAHWSDREDRLLPASLVVSLILKGNSCLKVMLMDWIKPIKDNWLGWSLKGQFTPKMKIQHLLPRWSPVVR